MDGTDGGGYLAAVGRLADDGDVRRAGEHDRQAGAHQRVVVHDEQADRRVPVAGRAAGPGHAGHGSHIQRRKA